MQRCLPGASRKLVELSASTLAAVDDVAGSAGTWRSMNSSIYIEREAGLVESTSDKVKSVPTFAITLCIASHGPPSREKYWTPPCVAVSRITSTWRSRVVLTTRP